MTKVLAALALLALTACVQFAGDQLPKRSVDTLEKSKVAEVEYAFDANCRGWPTPETEAFCHVVLESGLRRLFADTDPAQGKAPLRLDISMGARPLSYGEEIWNAFTILTAYILPWHRELEYELQARASWQGKPLKTYHYKDSMNSWIWWPFLPVMVTGHRTSSTTWSRTFSAT